MFPNFSTCHGLAPLRKKNCSFSTCLAIRVLIHVLCIIKQWVLLRVMSCQYQPHPLHTFPQARPLQPSNNYFFDVVTTTRLDLTVNSNQPTPLSHLKSLLVKPWPELPNYLSCTSKRVQPYFSAYLFPIDQLAYLCCIHACTCTNWPWSVQFN